MGEGILWNQLNIYSYNSVQYKVFETYCSE